MTKARDIASAAPAPSTVSATELGYVDGVTSAIQTQIDAKTAKSTLTTTGDIYYASAANTPARLGIGSTDQVLKVTAGIPAWATLSAGGMTLISETVASALSSLSFTSLGSYKQLLLMWSGIKHSGNGSIFAIRFNNDSGTVYRVGGINFTETSGSGISNNRTSWDKSTGGNVYAFGEASNAAGAETHAHGELLIDNYTSSTKDKVVSSKFGYYRNDTGEWKSASNIGMFDSTTAITSIDIVRLAGTDTFSNDGNTTIRLYGVA
jgi:hypothetical protein